MAIRGGPKKMKVRRKKEPGLTVFMRLGETNDDKTQSPKVLKT